MSRPAGGIPPPRRVAVIGAGVAGLTAAKALLEEGLTPVVLERRARVGGLWNYDEAAPDGGGLAYRSLRTNTSRRLTEFSDFAFPDTAPDYPHRAVVADYLHQYAARFGVLEHIQFSTTVEALAPAADGRWQLRLRPAGGGPATEAVFDAVIVASGLFGAPAMPSVPGVERFQGSVLHSAAYKAPEPLAGQRVLVVGIGSSGADIAVEVSHAAARVLLSTPRGAWVVPRYVGPRPFDHQNTRLAALIPARLRRRLLHRRLLGLYRALKLDHTPLAREPFDPALSRTTPGTDILERIAAGAIQVKPGLGGFDGRAVTFTDGTRAEIDAVIFCTGYRLSLPFLSPELLTWIGTPPRPALYKLVFPPDLPGLAFIGFFQATGSIPPLAEMQARWVARVFAGRAALPSAADQRADIAREQARLPDNGALVPRVPWLGYMNEIAGYVGARPRWGSPRRWLEMLVGPVLPGQFREKGKG